MNLADAKIFVARFTAGNDLPGEHSSFLEWLQSASMEEIGAVADEQEALLVVSSGQDEPSPDWISQLENKLDKVEVGQPPAAKEVLVRRFYGRPGVKWVSAAALVGLIAGAIYLRQLHPTGSVSTTADEPVKDFSRSFSVARGAQQQQFELSDGSTVWLNAASTLRYTPSFNSREREVELTGEAYFNVARNAALPFQVIVKDAKIQVLGTSFNVMAYGDEPLIRTTLIDGSVRIVRGAEQTSLQPGDQAEIAYPVSEGSPAIQKTRAIAPVSAISWKNGDLEFNNDDLQVVMREIARCFDVEVKYEGQIPQKRFTGNFSRKDGLEMILKQLEFQHIKFRIAGKTITVFQ